MTKNLWLIFGVFTSLFIFSSCAHTLYPTDTLTYNYGMKMMSDEELQIKARVLVFMSEKEIKGDYSVISVNSYTPLNIPIIYTTKSQIKKKFFKKAVIKADEQGGNGIIVTAPGFYKVIKIMNWDSDSAKPETFVNLIFDKTVMNKFSNGEVAKMSKSDVKRYEAMFPEEIKLNIKSAKTLEEVAVIREKLAVLEAYNDSLNKPKSSIAKETEEMEKSLNTLEKRIQKKIAKEAKAK